MKSAISKIFIGFLVISFVFFGINSFLLSGSGSWVAKVGNKKISYNSLQKTVKTQRDAILRANPNNKQALQYVNSQKFSVDILSKLINQEMLAKLGEHYGVNGDRSLIFQQVAKDKSFYKNNKFDRQYFKYFLAQNGLDEESYIELIQNEVINAMVMNSLSMTSPINPDFVEKMAILQNERRYGDIIYITKRNIRPIKSPKKEELLKIYEKNKKTFILPEKRNISYIILKKSDILGRIWVTNKEALEFYTKNKENYKKQEKRNFYHIAFKDKKSAKKFAKSLKKAKNKEKTFLKLGKKEKKSTKQLTISAVTKDNMIKTLADPAFALKKGEISKVLKSDLGFHVFLLREITDPGYLSFLKAKKDIKKQILAKKQQEIFQNKVAQIDETLLANNSLQLVRKKFSPNSIIQTINIDEKGTKRTASLKNFVENAFTTKQGQASILNESGEKFYALKVNKITKSRQQNFDEVKKNLQKLYRDNKENEAIKALAKKIAEEIRKNPKKSRQIARKNGLRYKKSQEFTRQSYIEFQGQKIPYSDKFSQELFALKPGNSTNYYQNGTKSYKIAILKKIKQGRVSKKQLQKDRDLAANQYRQEFIEAFNAYMQSKYKIDINKQFLNSLKQKWP